MNAFRHGRAAIRSLAFLTLSLSPALADTALAGNFSVSPVRIELSAQTKVAALSVHNGGAEPVSIQLELLEWDQLDGEEIHTPTAELLATPPIFTIPAGQAQVVRVGLRRPPDQDAELAYRLILQEIPAPAPDNFVGLRMALRISMPVFVAPLEGQAVPDLQWSIRRETDGGVALTAVNRGNAHGQIAGLRLNLGDQQLESSDNTYVLPGKSHTWQLMPVARLAESATLELVATINGSEITLQLPLE